jgi:hypothetical protein
MPTLLPSTLNERFTHKANLKSTRFGWLRLTPAYSVHLVSDLADPTFSRVLDPFCGTGTTALVCGEKGIAADTTDINPFLVWLAEVKTRLYSDKSVREFMALADATIDRVHKEDFEAWLPPIHDILKWWDKPVLETLGKLMAAIHELEANSSKAAVDLLKITFCRTVIDFAHVSFGHQSMSFKRRDDDHPLLLDVDDKLAANWRAHSREIFQAAQSPVLVEPRVLGIDARNLSEFLPENHYDAVITSPPYPNRMSYIRELRPYMYWLDYLRDGKEAGALDWKAIGGTWGSATSNVAKWSNPGTEIPFEGFAKVVAGIAQKSALLANYVHKYFVDIWNHLESLKGVLQAEASVNYIVGNSKFYDVLLPVEQIFAAMFREVGFSSVSVRAIRKRTSKKELFEFVVSGNAK